MVENIYLKNINCIKECCSYLDTEAIEKCAESEDSIVQFELTQKNYVTAKVNREDSQIYLHSKYDPVKEAEAFFANLALNSENIVILFGAGLFYQIREIISKSSAETKLIVIEPNWNILTQVIKTIDITDVFTSEKIYFIVNENADKIEALLKTYLNKLNIENTILTSLVAYENIFHNEYNTLKNTIQQMRMLGKIERNTFLNHGEIWQKNSIENTKYILNSFGVSAFCDKFTGKPAVIVGAGPSLSKNIHLLNELKDKVLIIATYTSVRLLLRNNIIPDIMVATDGRQLIQESKEAIKTPVDIPLLFISPTDTRLLAKAKSHKIFGVYSFDKFYKSRLELLKISEPILYVSGTVTTTALDFAVKAGCDPIVFIGQDLAFTDDKIYADPTYLPTEAFIRNRKWFLTEDVFGGQVYTEQVFEFYKKILEKYIAHDKTQRTYIDATEGGAKILGTEITAFKNICEIYEGSENNIPEILNEIFIEGNKIFREETRTLFYENLKNTINKMQKNIQNIEENLIRSDYLRITARVNFNNRKEEDIVYMDNLIEKINMYHSMLKLTKDEIKICNYCYELAECAIIENVDKFDNTKIKEDKYRLFAWDKIRFYRRLLTLMKNSCTWLKELKFT